MALASQRKAVPAWRRWPGSSRSCARLATTAINRLHATGGRYALCTMCIGVRRGIALISERV
jgi:hypothetical protein